MANSCLQKPNDIACRADNNVVCSPAYAIDATHAASNRSRFMAHSLTPNCQMQNWTVDNQQRVYVLAVKDIAPGAELTYTFYQQCTLGEHVRYCLPKLVSWYAISSTERLGMLSAYTRERWHFPSHL